MVDADEKQSPDLSEGEIVYRSSIQQFMAYLASKGVANVQVQILLTNVQLQAVLTTLDELKPGFKETWYHHAAAGCLDQMVLMQQSSTPAKPKPRIYLPGEADD